MTPNSVCQDFDCCVDGDLEPERQVQFEQHLPHCESCQSLAGRWREVELDVIAANLLFGDAHEGPVLQSPRTELSKSTGRPRLARRSMIVSLVAHAACIVVVASGILAWRFDQQQAVKQRESTLIRSLPSDFVLRPTNPCIPLDPFDTFYVERYPAEMPFAFESGPRLGIRLTGQLCVLPSGSEWP